MDEDRMGLRVQSETMEITKDEKGLVGISIGGGAPCCACVYVVQVFDGSPCAKDGRIRAGDEVVAVNGISVKGERKSAVAQLIQVSLNPVKITINKLEHEPKKGKTFDILLKKIKHKIVEFMDQDSADALGLSRAILCKDPLAAKLKILEANTDFYTCLVSYFNELFHCLGNIGLHQKEFGDIFCDLAAHEKQSTANEAFTAFGERHRHLEKKQLLKHRAEAMLRNERIVRQRKNRLYRINQRSHPIETEALKQLRPIVAGLQVYIDHVIPDTQLTIRKYLDVKYEYLSYCLKLKEMDDEEAEFAAIQESLYRIETGNYEYRLMLNCRQECRQRFLQMRNDVMIKIELLDQKHVRDIAQHLVTFARAMAKCQSECAEVLSDPIEVPIEIDLAQLCVQSAPSSLNAERSSRTAFCDEGPRKSPEWVSSLVNITSDEPPQSFMRNDPERSKLLGDGEDKELEPDFSLIDIS